MPVTARTERRTSHCAPSSVRSWGDGAEGGQLVQRALRGHCALLEKHRAVSRQQEELRGAWDAHWVLEVDGWSPWLEARPGVSCRDGARGQKSVPATQLGAWPGWAHAAAGGKCSRFCLLLTSTARRNAAPSPGGSKTSQQGETHCRKL